MIDISDDQRRHAFSVWLPSGRLPSIRSADGIELKFNPWHDPETGRFTFVGAGQRYSQWATAGPPAAAAERAEVAALPDQGIGRSIIATEIAESGQARDCERPDPDCSFK